MSNWRQAGIAPLTLAVNLSVKHLQTGEELVGAMLALFTSALVWTGPSFNRSSRLSTARTGYFSIFDALTSR
jgi:hypothetical protein